jgi:hypothetical protein
MAGTPGTDGSQAFSQYHQPVTEGAVKINNEKLPALLPDAGNGY